MSHQTSFSKKLDKLIEQTNLIEIVNQYCHLHTSRDILEMIDNKILYILDKARKYIETPQRQIPYSKAKVKARVELLFCKSKLKIIKRQHIDLQVLKKKKTRS